MRSRASSAAITRVCSLLRGRIRPSEPSASLPRLSRSITVDSISASPVYFPLHVRPLHPITFDSSEAAEEPHYHSPLGTPLSLSLLRSVRASSLLTQELS